MMTKIFLRKEEKKKICLRKDSVIDLLNILDKDLWRAGYGRFVWCFCICCMHWVIHKVSRAIAKRKEHSLSFPEYLKYTKRKSKKKVNILFWLGLGGRLIEKSASSKTEDRDNGNYWRIQRRIKKIGYQIDKTMYRLPNILHRTFKMTVSQGWVD